MIENPTLALSPDCVNNIIWQIWPLIFNEMEKERSLAELKADKDVASKLTDTTSQILDVGWGVEVCSAAWEKNQRCSEDNAHWKAYMLRIEAYIYTITVGLT